MQLSKNQKILIGLGIALLLARIAKGGPVPIVGFFVPDKVPDRIRQLQPQIAEIAGSWELSVMAIAWQESGGVHIKSDGSVIRGAAGEIGICQIMPKTGEEMGYSVADLMTLEGNLSACRDYLIKAKESGDEYFRDAEGTTTLYDMYRFYNGGPRVFNDYDRYRWLSTLYATQVTKRWEVVCGEFCDFNVIEDEQ